MTSMVDISAAEQRIAERVDPRVANSLAVSGHSGGVQFANAGEVMEWAKMMSVASAGVRKHLRGNPGACLAICVQAVEWGMSSFAVANKSYFVNDQIAFESQLIQAVILKRAPIKGRLKFEFTGEGANRVCRAWARLREDPEEIVEYVSPLFKDIQPKNSPLWKSDPDQQHCYMAGRALCRRHFPDVLLGVYADDELEPGVGPEKARDVTPAKNLAEKFDQLAAAPARGAAASTFVDHDPATGEVGTADTSESDSTDAGDVAPDPAKIALLEKLHAKAAKGTDTLRRALAGLGEADGAMLGEQDHEALGAAADAAKTKGA